jgi:hypothetical protein
MKKIFQFKMKINKTLNQIKKSNLKDNKKVKKEKKTN